MSNGSICVIGENLYSEVRGVVMVMSCRNRPSWRRIIVGFLLVLVWASAVLVSPAAPAQAEARPICTNPAAPSTPPRPEPCRVIISNENDEVAMQIVVEYYDTDTLHYEQYYLDPEGGGNSELELPEVLFLSSIVVRLAHPGGDGNWLVYENIYTVINPPGSIYEVDSVAIDLDYQPSGSPYFTTEYRLMRDE